MLENKGKQKSKIKGLKKKEEKEKKSVKTVGEDPKDNVVDNDDSSSTTTETSNPDVETNLKEVCRDLRLQSNVINSVHTLFKYDCHLTGTSKEERKDGDIWKGERRNFEFPKQTQRKETRSFKKRDASREIQVSFLKLKVTKSLLCLFLITCSLSARSSLELPYVTPLENKRRSFSTKALHPIIPKSRPTQKPRSEFCTTPCVSLPVQVCPCDTLFSSADGKPEDGRPSLLATLSSSSSVPELGHSSSSEGEKEFASPEWDVPLTNTTVRKSPPPRPPQTLAPLLIRGADLLLFSHRGRQSTADLPPDYKCRPLPEEIRHSWDLLPPTHLPQLTVPRLLQQCAQQQQVFTAIHSLRTSRRKKLNNVSLNVLRSVQVVTVIEFKYLATNMNLFINIHVIFLRFA